MWDSLNEDTLSRLPRSGSDGQANWKQCFAKLEEFRTYGDDWDGQGAAFGKPAATITAEVIDKRGGIGDQASATRCSESGMDGSRCSGRSGLRVGCRRRLDSA